MADQRARLLRLSIVVAALALAGAGAGCGDDTHAQVPDAMAVMTDDGGGADASNGGADAQADHADAKTDAAADAAADRADAQADHAGDVATDAATDQGPDATPDGGGGDGGLGMEVGATCSDNVRNGNETDIDCGGSCGRCANTKHCAVSADCLSSACNAAGICVECLTADTCPGQDGECSHRTCTDGACGVAAVAAGTVLATQTAGDCQVRRCDGQGAAIQVADDTDKPDDGNPCTDDVCTGGVASNPPSASDTACGTANVCDGQGHCVGCVTGADCPGTDTECRTRSCSAQSVCGFTFAQAGTPSQTQIAGDCHVSECDGNGNLRTSVLDTDVPDDGNACTIDSCSGGVPSHAPVTPAGATCGGGNVCDGTGHCVQCLLATTCPGEDNVCQTRTCGTDGTCGFARVPAGTPLASQTPGDCQSQQCDGLGHLVNVPDPTDAPSDGNACTDDGCVGGVPTFTPVAPGTACGDGRTCDANARCIQCATAADCPGQDTACQTRTCSADGVCGVATLSPGTPIAAQMIGDCQVVVCDATGNAVPMVDDNDLPVDGNVCTDDVCTNGAPSNPPVAPETSCGGSNVCDGAGHCFGCLVDADCPGTTTECQRPVCRPDFVCDVDNATAGTPVAAQVTGDCKVAACDGNGNIGQTPDDNDVPVDGNACTQDVCTAGVPSNPPANPGVSCGGTNVCDGTGICLSSTRPQITNAQAANFTILSYLAQTGTLGSLTTDNWDPTAGVGDVSTFVPNFVVGPTAAFTTVQSAVNAAQTQGGTQRLFIQVMPGTYREPVCVKSASNTPITIYSTDPNAADTTIVFNNWAGLAAPATGPTNACAGPGATTFGTSASATFAIFSRDVQVKNITFSNDFDETGLTNNLQAVALETQADKLVFENVRVLGNQDTLYVKSGNVNTVTRNYFKSCYVEGDVDAIFGRGVLVMDGCQIQYVSNRRGPTNGGDLVSPSTDIRNNFGQLIINSTFTADANTAPRTVALGRAWDEGFNAGQYPPATGTFPNGQAVIRDSVLGAHILPTAPWLAAASTGRPFSVVPNGATPANRLFELHNGGPGSAGGSNPPPAAAVQAILNANCTSCHAGATPPQGLSLTDVTAVVGTAARECTAKLRIAAGDSLHSYLVDKVRGASQAPGGCFAGVRMPRGLPALADADIATIAAWIDGGAVP
jgi:pectin methylesterase-like acyl-CoA thioesterase